MCRYWALLSGVKPKITILSGVLPAEVEDLVKREPDASITNLIGGENRRSRSDWTPHGWRDMALIWKRWPTCCLPPIRPPMPDPIPPRLKVRLSFTPGGFLKDAEDVGKVVVGIRNENRSISGMLRKLSTGPKILPVCFLRQWTGGWAFRTCHGGYGRRTSGRHPHRGQRKGTNAIHVANKVLERLEDSRGTVIPDNINVTITRHYGETAKEKSDELLLHMFIAIISVSILIWFTLGRRESGVVALAIPVTLALTLAVIYLYGYTLNRITLFALIFSIGILVDDAIVVVENVVRHFRLEENRGRSKWDVTIEAVDEVGNPTILATLTVIAAILPMAFVGGLMGPYMRPFPWALPPPWSFPY